MALIVVDDKDVKGVKGLNGTVKPIPLPVKMLITMVLATLPAILKPPVAKDLKSILIDIRDILNDAALD
mgnify:CR=1 FL=1